MVLEGDCAALVQSSKTLLELVDSADHMHPVTLPCEREALELQQLGSKNKEDTVSRTKSDC